jgi:hypothetical protein
MSPCVCVRYDARMNMFKPSKESTIEGYLRAIPEDRREAVAFLHAFIQKTAPSLRPYFATNMLGYGSFPWKNSKKEMIEWPVIAMANQKQHITVFVCSVEKGQYLVEQRKDELGKAKIGKTAISFQKLSELDLDGLARVIRAAEQNPGLAGLGKATKQ